VSESNDQVSREKLLAYLYGELSPEEGRQLEARMDADPALRTALEGERKILGQIDRLKGTDSTSEALRQRVVADLRARVRPSSGSGQWARFRPAARHWFAAACVLILMNGFGLWTLAKQPKAPALKVLGYTPQGTASSHATVELTFDRPMVSPEAVGKPAREIPLVIEPKVPGNLVWESDRKLVLHPLAPLCKATHYAVETSPALAALDGGRLADPLSFAFETTPLQLLSFTQEGRDPSGQVTLHFSFDDDVSPKRLSQLLEITNDSGEKLAYEVLTDATGPKLDVQVQAKATCEQLKARIQPGLAGQAGPLPLGETIRMASLDTALRLQSVETSAPSTGGLSAKLDLTDVVDPEQFARFATVEPKAAFKVEKAGKDLRLVGDFEAGKHYTLKLAKGLVSEHGVRTLKDSEHVLAFGDRENLVRLAQPGEILQLDGPSEFTLETVNRKEVTLKIHRVYPNNLVHFVRSGRSRSEIDELGCPLMERELLIPEQKNVLVRTPLKLTELLQSKLHGPYLITIQDKENYWSRESRFVLATDLGVTVKRSGDELLVWVASLGHASSVQGAHASVWTSTNQKIAEADTDASGIARITLDPKRKDSTPFLVQVASGEDLSYLKLGEDEWNLSRFDPSGLLTLTKGYRAYLYSDRGVYRPGETAHLAGILRDTARQVPPSFPMLLTMERSDGSQVRSFHLMSGVDGRVETDWKIPEDTRTGVYQAKLSIPGEKTSLGSYAFQVEDFVPDRLKVDVGVPKGLLKLGDPLPVKVAAHQLYGAPAAGRRVVTRVTLAGRLLTLPKLPEYTFGDTERAFKNFSLPESESTTGGEGEASLSVKMPEGLRPPAVLEANVQCTVHELGGRATTRAASVLVSPYPAYLGIRRLGEETVRPGGTVELECISVDASGATVPVPSVVFRAVRYDWIWNLRRESGSLRYDYSREEHEVQRETLSLAQGKATCRFTPSEYGEYRIFVEVPDGGMRTSIPVSTWGGENAQASGAREYLEVRMDKEHYAAGDVARAHIRGPFDGTALVCLEREKVHDCKVVQILKGEADVEFVVKPEYLPNVYCTATLIRPVVPEKTVRPQRAYGAVALQMDTRSRQLEVQVDSVPETLPEREVTVSVTVKRGGVPAPGAAFTLAAVDEGICQVTRFKTPDPFACFYGKEKLQVDSADLYAKVIAEEPAGDAGGHAAIATAPVRAKRFRPVALWKSGLMTDENGKATVTLRIPKYLGELRFMAVASSGDGFGSAQTALRVAQPAILEVTAPRFAAWGDEFEVIASVMNRTGKKGTAGLGVTAEGGLEISGPANQSKELAQNEEGVFTFRLKAKEGISEGTLVFQGALGSEGFSETVHLPLRPSAGKAFETGTGTLEAGKPQKLKIPAHWMAGTGTLEITLSRKPNLRFVSGLEYLLHYPYGCVEQTTSTAMPLLYAGNLLPPETKVAPYVDAALQRLCLMQTPSGGLSMWPGGDSPWDWGTVYAANFMVEAKKAGYEVPPGLLEGVTKYLKAKVKATSDGSVDREVRAYAAFVLASNGEMTPAAVSALASSYEKANPTERACLAAALAAVGKGGDARKLLSEVAPGKVERETGYNLHSQVRDDALLLSAFLEAAPDAPEVQKLVAGLEASSLDGRWDSTQENAFALMALGKYAGKFSQPGAEDVKGVIREGKETLRPFNSLAEAFLILQRHENADLEIQTEGTGKLFYRWTSEGIPKDQNLPDVDQGIQVRRRLLDEKGNPLAANKIRQGDLVWVELSIQGDHPYRNIALTDLLPAGMEAENPRLANTAKSEAAAKEEEKQGKLDPEYADFRDDRVEFFVNLPDTNAHKVRYALRAVTAGKFHLAPSQAVCMYHPLLQSRSGGTVIEVVR